MSSNLEKRKPEMEWMGVSCKRKSESEVLCPLLRCGKLLMGSPLGTRVEMSSWVCKAGVRKRGLGWGEDLWGSEAYNWHLSLGWSHSGSEWGWRKAVQELHAGRFPDAFKEADINSQTSPNCGSLYWQGDCSRLKETNFLGLKFFKMKSVWGKKSKFKIYFAAKE